MYSEPVYNGLEICSFDGAYLVPRLRAAERNVVQFRPLLRRVQRLSVNILYKYIGNVFRVDTEASGFAFEERLLSGEEGASVGWGGGVLLSFYLHFQRELSNDGY